MATVMDPNPDILGIEAVCKLLDKGAARVRQLDHLLRPLRLDRKGTRVYRRKHVEAIAAMMRAGK